MINKYLVYYPLFWIGYIYYLVTSRTPRLSYISFRKLFCLTNGKLNDFMTSLSAISKPKYEIKKAEGILGSFSGEEIKNIADKVQEDGVYVFEKKLPEEICNDMLNFSLNTPAKVIPQPAGDQNKFIYDKNDLKGTRYQFEENELFTNKNIQEIASDEIFTAIAQEYFGSKPLNEMVTMWWSTPFSKEASSEAAQLYHFDMDRLKFIKFFVYLTDVTTDTGPHCYIRGSHKGLPKPLRKDGRIPDVEINKHYDKKDLLELTGSKGTIMAIDTRGLHKGKPLVTGDRLIFQLEFATSFFGQSYNKIKLNKNVSDNFLRAYKKYNHTYKRFEIS